MLKYSLAKLCGTPVQYERKGKRSYEKSIERTIELIGSYLKNENRREICLEDAKITNKFIAKRMETDLNTLFDTGLFCSIWSKYIFLMILEGFWNNRKKSALVSMILKEGFRNYIVIWQTVYIRFQARERSLLA